MAFGSAAVALFSIGVREHRRREASERLAEPIPWTERRSTGSVPNDDASR